MSRNHDAKGLRWSPRSRGTAAGGLVDTTVHDKGNGADRGVLVPDLGGLIAASTTVLESGQELHLLEGGVYITRECKYRSEETLK